jgi:endonuclease-3 related protein
MELRAQQAALAPSEVLLQYYSTLLHSLGPQRWWPARTRLEVIVGAILTQNTNWRNAELALEGLRKARRLTWRGLRQASVDDIEKCIRPAGFYRQKARTIRNFVEWLKRAYGGSLNVLFAQPPTALRQQLLALKGLGPETADAIIVYAGKLPSFVADAYTRRILSRHALLPTIASYAVTQEFLHDHLPSDPALFNEFHALLVEVGKRHCKRQAPECTGCPLESYLPNTPHRQIEEQPLRRQDAELFAEQQNS